MRLFVTGGAGFVGANYVRHVLATTDDEVTVFDALTYAGSLDRLSGLDSQRLQVVVGDVADRTQVDAALAGHDAVVHFAAESHVDRSLLDPAPFLHSNCEGTAVLCAAALAADVSRFVHISTDEVYGPLAEGAADEAAPLLPTSPYARSKATSDLIALAHHRDHGLPVMVTRSSNQLGPWQFPEKLVAYFVALVLAGRQVPVYGDGRQVRDWLHVEDNCRATDLVLRSGSPGEVYNVAGHNHRTNLEVASAILGLLDVGPDRIEHVADRPGHDRRYAMTTDRIDALGAPRPRPFDEAIEQTVAWCLEHRPWWEPLLAQVQNR